MLSDISRERIRSRMMKNASQLWGVQASDINAFDPIVNMLFGAFSGEMEKIYHEVESSHSRVLERLSKLLIPEINKGPLPAHGIVHARANEARSVISKSTQVFFQKRIPSRESSVRETFRDIYFTPVTETLLFNGDIQYLAFGKSIYANLDSIHKEKMLDGTGGKRIDNNTLWVAVDLSTRLESLNGLSFYFDWLTASERDYFSRFLPSTKWSLNGLPLDVTFGIIPDQEDNAGEILEPEVEFDPARNVERDVLNYYNDRFVTINLPSNFADGIHSLSAKLPDELKSVFSEAQVNFIQKKLFWFKVSFPPSLSTDVIENIFCSINAFPAVNRRFNEFTYRLQPQFNIIPLNAGNDHFFSVHSVKASDGSKYNSSSMADTHKIAAGMYVIRRGGIERFDTRNASELLTYLVELMRDESASFAIFGQEMIASDLRELNQNLNVISQKLDKTTDDLTPVSYLVLKTKNQSDVVFVEYWSTTGDFGNNQKTGTKLMLASGSNVSNDHLVLLSNTTGGRDGLSESETLNHFKHALLSRQRIVSEADILNVCHRELGNLIKDVKIEKGLENDSKSFSGFKRTIDVVLYPANEFNPSVDEWTSLCRSLQIKLEKGSAVMMPIRVKLFNPSAN
ncbi:MAG TPA: hypothetical protein VG603_04935 [Chitinophagales bacterium]|nr:hypothetical protein [Chitinophagales bacterium]